MVLKQTVFYESFFLRHSLTINKQTNKIIEDITTKSLFESTLLKLCTATVLAMLSHKENYLLQKDNADFFPLFCFLSAQSACNQDVPHLTALLKSYTANSFALEVLLLEMHSRKRNQDCKRSMKDRAQQCISSGC